MSRWARENPERMAEIAALPLSEQNDALRAEAVGVLPCDNANVPFSCPTTYSPSEWSEVLRAYYCRECGVSDE